MRDDSSPFRGLWVALIISVVVVFLVFAISSGHTPELSREQIRECQRYWERHQYCEALVEPPPRVILIDWLSDNSEWLAALITAGATIFIAYFTHTLQKSTDKLWRATIARDLPIVGLSRSSTNPEIKLTTDTVDPVPGGIPPPLSTVVITIANLGNTVIHITEFCVEWRIARELGRIPVYSYIGSTNQMVPEKTQHAVAAAHNLVILEEDQLAAIRGGQERLWVYGFIRYRDFLGDAHEFGFVAHWEAVVAGIVPRPPRGFVVEGPAAYNYST